MIRNFLLFGLMLGLGVSAAHAERIDNPVAKFSGLDKITGRIISFDVYMDETVQFGALQVTPRVCYSRPLTETPKTDAFVEVDEITIDLPRPRPAHLGEYPEFSAYAKRIYGIFEKLGVYDFH